MNYCYDELVYHQDCYNFHIDPDMRHFLLDREKVTLILAFLLIIFSMMIRNLLQSKQFMLDVLLTCPEFIPLMWGGEAVGLPDGKILLIYP